VNRTNRTQIGGWAALVAALAIPIKFGGVIAGSGSIEERLSSTLFVGAEMLQTVALLVAVIGLDPWFREGQPRLGHLALAAGVAGPSLAIAADGLTMLGWLTTPIDLLIFVAVNAAIAAWFIIAGAIVAGFGGEFRRIGWVGQFGGAGTLLTTSLLAVGFAPEGSGLQSWYVYAQLLQVFVIVFLVRLWRFAALGRLPGPEPI
jgi:hypothetical protein